MKGVAGVRKSGSVPFCSPAQICREHPERR